MDEIRLYDVSAQIGYGFPVESLEVALKWDPHVLVAQGTSTDAGPYYLGAGASYTEFEGVKRDLKLAIKAAKEHGIPFIFSVGGAGADIHVKEVFEIINQISKELKFRLTVAFVSGEISKEWLKRKLVSGSKAKRLVNFPRLSEYLTAHDVDESVRIVAQMGPEPIMKALDLYFKGEVDGVITGRSLDVGVVAAYPLRFGMPKNLVYHMSKILECGAIAADPGSSSDGIFGIINKDYFLVRPPNPKRRCTVTSVAAHSFYERDNPLMEKLPEGYLDVTTAKYVQFDERTVMVSGSRFVPTPYTIKLEGVKQIGFRTISIAGSRDPTFISKINSVLEEVTEIVKDRMKHIPNDEYVINFRVYGINGVMGIYEPLKNVQPHEVGIVIDVVAKTQEIANSVCALARATLLHHGFDGRKTTAGNIAFPFSPSDFPAGPVFEFNIWHTLELDDPTEPFRIEVLDFPR
ncbi:MAG: acyclic terpene utilization AtuA family protein [Sulfolobales archaeon]